MMTADSVPAFSVTTAWLLDHWQGHRRVTRRVIEAFPESQLFSFSVGGMRPFALLAFEMISMARAGIRGVALREWEYTNAMMHHAGKPPETRAALLEVWDATTAEIEQYWPQIPPQRFEEVDNAFGAYEGIIYGLLWYWIDNEIHHRGQGYVYLRALGIEPPPFYDWS
jgi:uncharacterized damage-inducible protein DinB